jgi:hypothetical protein
VSLRALARWACIRAGNLAVWLAPHAGIQMALRVGRPRPMAGGVIQHRPTVFDATCQNCYDVTWVYGREGVEALDKTCETCGARRWRLRPHEEHQQSRRV